MSCDPSFTRECGECGEEKRVNDMGQSTHRCWFKEESADAAETLYTALIEHRDYCHVADPEIVLTVYDDGDTRTKTILPVAEVEKSPEQPYPDTDTGEWRIPLASGGWYPQIQIELGHRGRAVVVGSFLEATMSGRVWVTDVDIRGVGFDA